MFYLPKPERFIDVTPPGNIIVLLTGDIFTTKVENWHGSTVVVLGTHGPPKHAAQSRVCWHLCSAEGYLEGILTLLACSFYPEYL